MLTTSPPPPRADIPEANYANNVTVRFAVPRTATTVIPELGPGAFGHGPGAGGKGGAAGGGSGQSAEYVGKDREVVWTIKRFAGQSELTLRTKITLSAPSTTSIRKELGPISLGFEIPMFNSSGLQVKYLRIAAESRTYKPYRWVRYVTTSASYVCRL